MDYKYDIFISYPRDIETKRWIDVHFLPLLSQRVKLELKRVPIIFIDDQLEAGVIWPKQLGEVISMSRIIIPLWTGDYLSSQWCVCEISHMMEREDLTEWRKQKQRTLIFPIIVHDGNTLPKDLAIIQNIEVRDYFNSRMSIYSEKAEKLADRISAAAPGIAELINNVPKWDSDWKIAAINNFYKLYYKGASLDQSEVPKYSA